MGGSSDKVTYWKIPDESRQVMFLYNRFMSDRWLDDEYGERRGEIVPYKRMVSVLDSIITEIANNSSSRESKFFEGTLKDLRVGFDPDLLFNPADVKKLMIKLFNEEAIPDSYFDWLDVSNSELCNFAWAFLMASDVHHGYFKVMQSISLDEHDLRRVRGRKSGIIERHLERVSQYATNTTNNQGKKDFVICYFDLLGSVELEGNIEGFYLRRRRDIEKSSIGGRDLLKKKEMLLTDLRDAWGRTKNDTKMSDWLAKNKELSSWAYKYVEKNLLAGVQPVWLDLSADNEREREGKYALAVKTLYNLLGEDQKFIMRSQLTKSGSQQKYRLNTEKRKPSSIPLTEEHKQMLKDLAGRRNCKMYQVVEALIEDAYKNI